jgi:multidrug resistance protein MdtO
MGSSFEFGPTRQQDLMLRRQIREWQLQLRTLFLTRIILFKYRLQLTGVELPERVRSSQLEFDDRLAAILETMAERMEERAAKEDHDYKDEFEHLEKVLDSYCTEASHQSIAIEMKTFLALSHTAKSLVMSLAQEI